MLSLSFPMLILRFPSHAQPQTDNTKGTFLTFSGSASKLPSSTSEVPKLSLKLTAHMRKFFGFLALKEPSKWIWCNLQRLFHFLISSFSEMKHHHHYLIQVLKD